MELELRIPALRDEAAFWRAYDAAKDTDSNFFHFYVPGMTFPEWIGILEDKKKGKNLEPGLGPSTFFLAWLGGMIIGRLTFRQSMDEDILHARGHIGYVVLPEFRNKGYAAQILRLALPIAKASGLKRVLLTCDKGNTASQRTIEKCGGMLQGSFTPHGSAVSKLQFWIDLK